MIYRAYCQKSALPQDLYEMSLVAFEAILVILSPGYLNSSLKTQCKNALARYSVTQRNGGSKCKPFDLSMLRVLHSLFIKLQSVVWKTSLWFRRPESLLLGTWHMKRQHHTLLYEAFLRYSSENWIIFFSNGVGSLHATWSVQNATRA